MQEAMHSLEEGKTPVSSPSDTFQEELRRTLNLALQFYLNMGRPVLLEGLGIVLPTTETRQRTYTQQSEVIIRSERVRAAVFEKCDDDSTLPPDIRKNLVYTREITSWIYPRLPLPEQFAINQNELCFELIKLNRQICYKLMEHGVSYDISSVGTLYAFNNKRGHTFEEKFSNCDIQMKIRQASLVEAVDLGRFARPELVNAWEPFEAFFGDAIRCLRIEPHAILKQEGFDPIWPAHVEKELHVSVFSRPVGLNLRELMFVTDGLRNLSSGDSGSELVVQTQLDKDDTDTESWVSFMLSLGWALLVSRPKMVLKPGLVLSAGQPLCPVRSSKLSAVATQSCSLIESEQLTEGKAFRYTTLLGLTEDEASLVTSGKKHHLFSLLSLKGYDQLTSIHRRSILSSTTLS